MRNEYRPTDNIQSCINRCERVLSDGRSIAMAEDAEDELKAIRRAAKVILTPLAYSTDDWIKAMDLLKTLAKEAP